MQEKMLRRLENQITKSTFFFKSELACNNLSSCELLGQEKRQFSTALKIPNFALKSFKKTFSYKSYFFTLNETFNYDAVSSLQWSIFLC